MVGLEERLYRLQQRLDLKNKYPGYFRVHVFRIAFILIVLIFGLSLYTNNWNFHFVYAECPIEDNQTCLNPFYACKDPIEQTEVSCLYPRPSYCSKYEVCDYRLMYPGQTLGIKPNLLVQYMEELIVSILLLSFAINHILYKTRGKYYDN